ncbi:MAG: hypothetical protein RLY31_769 [Bacteroidota bacterium]
MHLPGETTPLRINRQEEASTDRTGTTVRHAVILAAGMSSRFREKGVRKPKVLMKVGGLRLLERSILTLHAAGIRHFRVVVGAYREQVVAEMEGSTRLRDIDVTYVESEQYALGNGVSFGDGAAGLAAPFLLTMSDHIFSVRTVGDFMERAMEAPGLPALACDGDLAGVFDMDDATKVVSSGGFIDRIGKEIEGYDLVDTGLFYFPAGYGPSVHSKAQAGAHSVSHIIADFIAGEGVRAIALPKAMWQDVDDPSMKKEAERRLAAMMNPTVQTSLTRRLTQTMSNKIGFTFAKLGVTPKAVRLSVLAMTLLGAWWAASGIHAWLVAGALTFQLATILEGSEQDLARLTLQRSRFSSWYRRFSADLRYTVFFGALGISAWRATGMEIYLFAVLLLAALGLYMLAQVSTFAWKNRHDTEAALTRLVPMQRQEPGSVIGQLSHLWREISRQDLVAFLTFLLGIIWLYQAMFWLALLGTTATAIMVSKSVHAAKITKTGANILERIDPIYFYLLGVVILLSLVFNMELTVVAASLAAVGNKLFLVFSIAILWILANTLCIRTLVDGKVSFPDLLFNQLTGDAYNTIIPLAGLGGEPYKIKHLTQWLDWHTASRAVVVDRLIHATTGTLFAAISTFVTLLFLDMAPAYHTILMAFSIGFAGISIGIIWLALSEAPSRISGYILRKLKIVEEFRSDPIPAGRFLTAFAFKFTGRVLYLVELYVIFTVLGFTPGLIDLTTVAGFIALSASLFFIIPQGLGVNELGISGALSLLGYSASLGITFGLIRRARMIFWALFGVALHLTVSVVKKVAVLRAAKG